MMPVPPDARIHLLRFPDLADEPDALMDAFLAGEGVFEDTGIGPDWALDRACVVAVVYKQPVLLWSPQAQVVVTAILPSQITIH